MNVDIKISSAGKFLCFSSSHRLNFQFTTNLFLYERLYVFHFSITFKKTNHIMRKLR